MITIESAWYAYLDGILSPWDLQEVVESYGFVGWTGEEDGTVIIHCN